MSNLGFYTAAIVFILAAFFSFDSSAESQKSRLSFLEEAVQKHPGSYPLQAQLAYAYFEKLQITSDPLYLKKARDALKKSMDVMPSANAFTLQAMISNYTHRLEETLMWVEKAKKANAFSRSINLPRMSALLGLGRKEEAKKLAEKLSPPKDPYSAYAVAKWHESEGNIEAAAEVLRLGLEDAKKKGYKETVPWYTIRIAGLYLDAGRPKEAHAYLELLDGEDEEIQEELLIHQAEYLEATQKEEEALQKYTQVLKTLNDPHTYAKAYTLAKKLGKHDLAKRYFEKAEEGYQKILDAGEIYALEGLALLWIEAEVNLDKALKLARKNLEYVKDQNAIKTLELAKQKTMP